MGELDRALVLGGGGAAGTAWMAGLVCGMAHDGVHLDDADLILGTSAGAIVGALLATGFHFDRLASPPQALWHRQAVDADVMADVFAVLGDVGIEPGDARRRVGRLALDTIDAGDERVRLDGQRMLLGTDRWPDRRLLITAFDAVSGELVVWDRTSEVSLTEAVTASTAFPGTSPPISVRGRRYIDGGLHSATHADLAAGAHTIVVVEPLAHVFPREALESELAAAEAWSVETIAPDQASEQILASGLYEPAAWEPAYAAGLRQGADAAERVRSIWSACA